MHIRTARDAERNGWRLQHVALRVMRAAMTCQRKQSDTSYAKPLQRTQSDRKCKRRGNTTRSPRSCNKRAPATEAVPPLKLSQVS